MKIVGSNDAPVVIADTGMVSEDAVTPLQGNVLSNDSDVDAGALLSVLDHGTRQGQYGTLTIGADGHYAYALDPAATQGLGQNQTVDEHFDYLVSDGIADVGSRLTITIAGGKTLPS